MVIGKFSVGTGQEDSGRHLFGLQYPNRIGEASPESVVLEISYPAPMPAEPSLIHPPPAGLGKDLLSLFALDPAIDFLNHGTFGAAPRAVLEAQTAWRQRLEGRPIELLDRRRAELLAPALEAVGRFVGAEPRNLGFVTNATGGANAVLRSLKLAPGDEIVTTNHVYNAIRQTMTYVAAQAGAKSIEVRVELPLRGPDGVFEPIAEAIGDRCRLVVIDHVTSPTAIRVPVERIIGLCADRGVDVLVDGAHAPGMLDLDVQDLGAAYYTGNLHKWVCAPKGAAFLWVRPDRQAGIHPNTISHFLGQGLAEEFAWQGTRDITAWLCAKDAIEFMGGFGWDRIRRHNHDLAVWVQAMLASRWGVEPISPLDGSMLGSMVTLPLPAAARRRHASTQALQARLYGEHRIEIPVIDWDGSWWIRASCQIYNVPQQYERLAQAVLDLTEGRR